MKVKLFFSAAIAAAVLSTTAAQAGNIGNSNGNIKQSWSQLGLELGGSAGSVATGFGANNSSAGDIINRVSGSDSFSKALVAGRGKNTTCNDPSCPEKSAEVELDLAAGNYSWSSLEAKSGMVEAIASSIAEVGGVVGGKLTNAESKPPKKK